MSTTPWSLPRRCAARDRASSTVLSVLRLVEACRTTASTWLSMGERIRVRAPPGPAVSSRARFWTLESPSPLAPPRIMAAPTLGDPSDALVTPVTRIPRGASLSTKVRVLLSMAPRSTSSRGHPSSACDARLLERREGIEDHVGQPVEGASQGIGGKEPEVELDAIDCRADGGVVCHPLVVDGDADDPGVREALDQGDLTLEVGHGNHREVAKDAAFRGMLHDHAGGSAAAQDVSRGQVRRVAERPLTFDHDDVGVLPLERGDDLVLDLAGTELGHEGVQRDAVLAALHDRGLTGADQDGLDTPVVQRAHKQGRGGALAYRAVGAEDGNAWADPAIRKASIATQTAGDVVRPHDLRHTCASLHIKHETPPKVLATMLGHALVAIALDRYGHLYPGDAPMYVDRFGVAALDARHAAQAARDASLDQVPIPRRSDARR